MTVLIKNMDKPKSCDGCQFYDDISRYCDAANRRLYKIDQPLPRWCPIEEAVQCKECVHYNPKYHYTCTVMDWSTDEHGYCSRGEKDEC